MIRSRGTWQSRTLNALALAWLVALTAGACGGGDDSPPSGPPPQPTCGLTQELCDVDAECCSGSCAFGTCDCIRLQDLCARDVECCAGLVCRAGACVPGCRPDSSSCVENGDCCNLSCESNVCEPARCNNSGEGCEDSSECCEALGCFRESAADPNAPSGRCRAGCVEERAPCGETPCCAGLDCVASFCVEVCQADGLPCSTGRDCCEGLDCRDGRCAKCAGRQVTCGTTSDCCEGIPCVDGVCVCVRKGDSCTSDAECCPGLGCDAGRCACGARDATCTSDGDCCADLACLGGRCEAQYCFADGQECAFGGQCCGEDCQDGACCRQRDRGCGPDSGCCENFGLACLDGVCTDCRTSAEPCSSNADCCSKSCLNGACCGSEDETCVGSGSCCEGLICGGADRCCKGRRAACSSGLDCCIGHECRNGECCIEPGVYQRCEMDLDCCPGSVCDTNGICCYPTGGPCITGSDCCSGQCDGTNCL